MKILSIKYIRPETKRSNHEQIDCVFFIFLILVFFFFSYLKLIIIYIGGLNLFMLQNIKMIRD